jgi:ribosomal protein S10
MNQMIKNLPAIGSTKAISREHFEFDTHERNWQLSRDINLSFAVWTGN